MNDIFNFFSPLSFVKSGTVAYNPLISYDWSTTTTSGLRYLKDVGSTPTYNASMYFGRGAYFNGVDQTITVPINTTIQTALKRVNGVVTINETSQTLTNYVISGLGVHKDYYLFTRLLRTSEKDSYINTPEAFYAMAQADSTCVLNMPMCETDGYVRNMKTYSKGSELDNSFVAGKYTSDVTTKRVAQFNLGLVVEAKKTYLVEIEYDDTANSILTGYFCFGANGGGGYAEFHTVLKGIVTGTKGTAFYLLQMPSTYLGLNPTTAYSWINAKTGGATAYISVRSLKELTGVYPISNYTSSVRANAKKLQYGLQTCKFVRDSLGVIQSASDYLECDGAGYADTGWNPSANEDWSIELIQEHSNNGLYHISGRAESSNARLYFGENNSGRSVVRYLNSNSAVSDPIARDVGHIVISSNFTAGLMKVYFSGLYIGEYDVSSFTDFTTSILLGIEASASEGVILPIRLFKVHNKALTQAEITANYNSYRAKGLLS